MAQLDEGGGVTGRPLDMLEGHLGFGPTGLAVPNHPHLVGAALAAKRARLQAERVRAWNKWHAEVFEQLRLMPYLEALPPASHGQELLGSDPVLRLPPAEAMTDIPTRSEQPAPGRGPQRPEPPGRAEARPSYERTKAALAESPFSSAALLLEDAPSGTGRGAPWRRLMRRLVRSGRRAAPPPPVPPAGPRSAAAFGAREPGRMWQGRIGAAGGAPQLDDPSLSAPSSERDIGALLQPDLGRLHVRLHPPVRTEPASAPSSVEHVPVGDSGSGVGADQAAPAEETQPGAPREHWIRELCFAAAVWITAFSIVAIPYTLTERGVISPARVANAFGLLAEELSRGPEEPHRAASPHTDVKPHTDSKLLPMPQAGMTSKVTTTEAAVASKAQVIRDSDGRPQASDPKLPAGQQADDAVPPARSNEIDLRSGETWSVRHALHELLGAEQADAAAVVLRGAAELNPDHPDIRYDIGSLFQRGGDIERAIAHYRRVVELEPDHPYALYHLGSLLDRTSRLAAAMPHYERAVQLLPLDPYVAFNFAALLERRGEVALARSMFTRVLDIGGPRQVAVDARSRLARLNGDVCA